MFPKATFTRRQVAFSGIIYRVWRSTTVAIWLLPGPKTISHRSIVDRRGTLADGNCVNDLPMACRFLRVVTRAAHP